MLTKVYKIFFFSFFLLGCSTPVQTSSKASYPLSVAESIKPGKTTKDEIVSMLKKPDKVISLVDKGFSNSNEAWLYLNEAKNSTRISMLFDKNSVLTEVNWFTESSDQEINLQRVLGKYAPAKFVISPAVWPEKQHYAPSERIYNNEDLGIKVVYMPGGDFVNSIAFSNPALRVPAQN